MLLTGREMLALLGKSKLFLARLASQDSQARRASEIGWLSDSFFSYFFVKKIPLSRRVEYVMDGSMDESVSESVSQ